MTGPTQTDFTPGSIPAPSSLDLGREDDEIEVLDAVQDHLDEIRGGHPK